MLPSRPRIQPVKGGAGRDRITSGWGNGFISELFSPEESGTYLYQDVTVTDESTGFNTVYRSIFCTVNSDVSADTYVACSNVFEGGTSSLPTMEKVISDCFRSFLVTDEILSSSDWQTFQSVHGHSGYSTGDWLRSPQPVISVNGAVKTEDDDYTVDYTNGRIDFGGVIKGDTTLSASAGIGDTVIGVVSEVGFEVGDLIIIAGDSSSENESVTVSAVATGELTLTESLQYAHSNGNTVIENDPVVTATYRYLEQHVSLYEMYDESAGADLYMLPASFAEYSERRDGGTGVLRLKNPLFLNWDGSEPDAWTMGGTGTGTVSKVSGLLGDHALQIDTTAGTNWVYCSQTFDGVTSGTVQFSCWVKTDSQAMLEIIPDGQSSSTIELHCSGADMQAFAGKWVRMMVETSTASSPIEVRMYAQTDSTEGGIAMFDGAMLLQV